METIQKGKAPLISIEVKDDDDVSLKITSRTHETQYIAISHIWSDGLENPKCNGLPSCQVKRLNQQIAKLKLLGGARPPPFIWIDTLCVPVEPEHSYYRKQEIKRMPSIYAAATAILVLDSELKHIDSRAINPAEILARIICSVWMQRCWTLQEGIVSRLCFFQFKDEPIDPPVFFFDTKDFPTAEQLYTYEILQSHLWERLHYGRSGGIRYSYNCKEALQRQRWEWVQSQPRKDSKGTRAMYPRSFSAQRRSRCKILAHDDSTALSYLALQLVRTWNELSHRSTSRIEDIYAIMASVLGFSPEKIMNLQNNAERLQVLLFSLPYLPMSLFFNTGPRHKQAEVHNNRWVPEDIGNCMLHEGGTMSFTDEGLHLNLRDRPDIYLVAGPSSHDITFHVSTQSEAIYEVKLFHEYSQGNDTLRSKYKYICIFVENSLSGDAQHTRGALFRILRTDGDECAPPESHEALDLIFDCPIDIFRTRQTRRDLDIKDITKIEHTTKIIVRYGEQNNVFQLLNRQIADFE